MKKDYGGNTVTDLFLDDPGKFILGSGPYEYYVHNSRDGDSICLDELKSFSLFILEKDDHVSVEVLDDGLLLKKGDSIQVENKEVNLKIVGGSAKFLLAGTKVGLKKSKHSLVHQSYQQIYKVLKPWGYELWINGQHPLYAFKEMYIQAGTKTSLQYHRFKQETNVLFNGKAALHYKFNLKTENDSVLSEDITEVELDAICSMDTTPENIHRLQAITNILLYEASTPHLDDVVRLQDDNKRPDGRIKEEHLPK